jgi:hypothetical protein
MMLRELDSVVLKVGLPEHGLEPGDVGTVVLIHGDHAGYEVEFATLDGDTITVTTLLPAQLRPVARGEIAHVRLVGATA